MASLELAMPVAMAHEIDPVHGGFVDNPADKGGPTNDGVTLATFRRHYPGATVDDLKAMTVAQRDAIYRADYWDQLPLGAVASQEVATKAFDIAINAGPRRAAIVVQEALCDLGSPVRIDGAWGPLTLAAVNAADPQALLDKMAEAQLRFYRRIVSFDPTQAVFLPDWTERASWGTSATTYAARPADATA